MQPFKKEKIKIFAFIFIPIVLVNFLVIGLIYYFSVVSEKSAVIEKESIKTESLFSYLEDEKENLLQDLLIYQTHEAFLNYIENRKKEDLIKLGEEFEDYLKIRGKYDQVRFINNDGQEIFRVNYNKGNPITILDEKDLQYKGDRYYFKEAITLDEGELYISSFDLNVENGEIEQPVKPVIRVANLIFNSKREKMGIFILNYFGKNLLDEIQVRFFANVDDMSLLNKDGYFLKSKIYPYYEWAFMYDNKKDLTFQSIHPEVWEKVKSLEKGYFENKDGLYTFSKIYPRQTDLLYKENGVVDDYYWFVVSFISRNSMLTGSVSLLKNIFYISILFVILSGVIIWFLAEERAKKRIAEKKISQLNNVLKIINKILRHDILNKIVGVREALDAFLKRGDKEYIDLIHQSVESGIRLISDMKDLEQLTVSGEELKKYDLR